MTLAAMIAQLLALGMVVWGMGFLPALGVASAAAMLLGNPDPVCEAASGLAVLIGVLPLVFLSRYQPDLSRESPRPAVPFVALGLMVLLQFTTMRAGVAGFPAGLCMALAGLVAVACRQTLVWQWAGVLTCGEGVLLFATQTRQAEVMGVAALACVIVLVFGGFCAHRTLLRKVASPDTRPPPMPPPRTGTPHPDAAPYHAPDLSARAEQGSNQPMNPSAPGWRNSQPPEGRVEDEQASVPLASQDRASGEEDFSPPEEWTKGESNPVSSASPDMAGGDDEFSGLRGWTRGEHDPIPPVSPDRASSDEEFSRPEGWAQGEYDPASPSRLDRADGNESRPGPKEQAQGDAATAQPWHGAQSPAPNPAPAEAARAEPAQGNPWGHPHDISGDTARETSPGASPAAPPQAPPQASHHAARNQAWDSTRDEPSAGAGEHA
ncbi:hypothetical protein K2X14_01290 [Acetobacter sp. TBRC 12305]|uniref:Uncharacterized protein n=1 Tax=Acetobacter garciniae TaxID=2817435 RepID=A0A939KPE3_9PROT|nr:hypothetical protein [Acetobacter garciniae]MBO1323787.1 hypothetical protein [Acetobacter garciniae]MBX0343476.1 hypothetical protein [Acetobacter garciniae]